MKNMRFYALALLALFAVPTQGQVIIGGGGGGGGSTSPGGSNTQVQYNNSGAFGGITGATTNGTALTLVAPNLGTPATGNASNLTNIPVANATGILPAANGGAGTINGIMKANGAGLVSAATSGTDYAPATSGSSILSGNGSGGFSAVTIGGCLSFSGGTLSGSYAINAQTGTTYTILSSDSCKLVTFSNGSATAVTLPQATGSFAAGFSFDVENKGAGAVTITPTTSTINGGATLVINQNTGCTITSDGTNYQVSACTAIGASSGTVTSVAQSFTGGLISVAGSPVTTSGTLALTVAGTSGGIPYFSSSSAWASSGALTANLPVIGGGAGAAPTVGSRSGNTTTFATTSGTLTSGNCAKFDASGNIVDAATTCGGGGGGSTYTTTFSGNVSGTPGATGLGLVLATATFTDNNTAGSGTAALFAEHSIATPTLAATNSTVTTTHATTLYIAGAPTAGTNETITAKSAVTIAASDLVYLSNASKERFYNVGSPGVTNREEVDLGWASNVFNISTAANGTGTATRDITITAGGTLNLNSTGFGVAIQTSGSTVGTFGSSALIGANAAGGEIQLNGAASATAPTLIPNRADATTGIGAQASGNISEVVGGVERVRYQSTGPRIITIPTDATKTDATLCRDTTTGDVYTGTGTIGICLGTSSARFKHGIADLQPGLLEIMRLKPKSYYLNKDHGNPNKLLYGFMAEDMNGVVPALVEKDKKGKPNTADYLGLVPVLVKAMQEQQREIASLKTSLALTKAKLDTVVANDNRLRRINAVQ